MSPRRPRLTIFDLGDSQTTLVGDDDTELVNTHTSSPLVSHTVDGAGLVIAFNSNRFDEDGGRSGEGSQPRGPSRMNGSPGRGLSLPEPPVCDGCPILMLECNLRVHFKMQLSLLSLAMH